MEVVGGGRTRKHSDYSEDSANIYVPPQWQIVMFHLASDEDDINIMIVPLKRRELLGQIG